MDLVIFSHREDMVCERGLKERGKAAECSQYCLMRTEIVFKFIFNFTFIYPGKLVENKFSFTTATWTR